MADEEIVVTHETLFELFRREKSRDELQKLSATFFSDVASYIKSKKELTIKQNILLYFYKSLQYIKNKWYFAKEKIKKFIGCGKR